ncbi:hypothetical protein NLJ89_g1992 [Agrocybe chaxingu]|uniref:Uncharacterized protein n=1 Tax=Agrocybe chaxingu TaxID=84603 RepID=A0A9W8MZ03_9AGAR|nr:hypothetical protein NLJ89_g1992 [Agrocybe chaxingu]
MVKFSTLLFASAGIAAVVANPGLTSTTERELTAREMWESVYGREIIDNFTDRELEEREPFFPLIFGAIRAATTIGRVASKAHKAHSAVQNHKNNKKNNKRKREVEDDVLALRDVEDMEEREPFFPLIFGAIRAATTIGRVASKAHKAHSAVQNHKNNKKNNKRKRDLEDDSLYSRDELEMNARGFEDFDLEEREFNDWEEREFDDLD